MTEVGRSHADADVRSVRRFVRSIGAALRLIWRAGPRAFVSALLLQAIASLGIGAELLLGRSALARLLHASHLSTGTIRQMVPILVGLLLATVITAIATSTVQAAERLMTENSIRYFQAKTLDAVAGVELATFESPEFFDSLQRVQAQGLVAPLRLSMALIVLAAGSIGTVALVAVLGTIQPLLLPFVLLAYVPLWFAASRNSRALGAFAFGQAARDRMRAKISDLLTQRSSAAEVRSFRIESFLRSRWDQLATQRLQDATKVVRRNVVRGSLAAVSATALTIGALALLFFLAVTNRVSLAGAGIAALAIMQLSSQLNSLAIGFGTLVEYDEFLAEVFRFFRHGHRVDDLAVPTEDAAPFESLSARGLSFRYPGSEQVVLEDLDFDLRAGEVVALVGENGSGKTTLAKILSGLYVPEHGTIEWNGVDRSELAWEAYGPRIGVTFQDFVRYPLSAAENIGVGRVDAPLDMQRIEEAATRAGVDDAIAQLPRGFDTVLSKEFEGGADLSTGQWQRIAIARTLFRDAGLVVLDEPTAALDPRAESELFGRSAEILRGRAVLLISHRFSSVAMADRIYVLDKGRVVESGTHDDLMAAGGRYAELYTLQARMYLRDDAPTDEDSPGGERQESSFFSDEFENFVAPEGAEVFRVKSLSELPPDLRQAIEDAGITDPE